MFVSFSEFSVVLFFSSNLLYNIVGLTSVKDHTVRCYLANRTCTVLSHLARPTTMYLHINITRLSLSQKAVLHFYIHFSHFRFRLFVCLYHETPILG